MRRRDFLVGSAAAVSSAGLPVAPVPALAAPVWGVGPMMYDLRLHLMHRIANPPILMDDSGAWRMLSTEADQRALERVNRMIDGNPAAL